MPVKTANVNTRMDVEIKRQAEVILERLGIPRSVAIDMFYRQIIAHNGIPFPVTLPPQIPVRDEMTEAQFDQMMSEGKKKKKNGETFDMEEVFSEFESKE